MSRALFLTFTVDRIIELQSLYSYRVFRKLLSDEPAVCVGGFWYRIKIEGDKSRLHSVECNPEGHAHPWKTKEEIETNVKI